MSGWLVHFMLCIGACFANPLVDIPGLGRVRGKPGPDSVDLFLGIPFAKPPQGELRWQPPEKASAWGTTPLLATEFPPPCAQSGRFFVDLPETSEDCLYLNIARRVGASPAPVMVWIHGGGNTGDYTANPMYNISNLVNTSVHSKASAVVVVSLQYRLNVFGWLGSFEMQATSNDGSTGNFGLQDQRSALQWVHDHIHAFGGNAQAVTIFGESAGGFDVGYHLTQPASYHLYQGAIIESYGDSNKESTTLEEADVVYKQVLNMTRCSNISCLRKVGKDGLENLTLVASGAWNPVTDGVNTFASPISLFANGHFNRVPVLIGSNTNEGSLISIPKFVIPQMALPANLSDAELDASLTHLIMDSTQPPLTPREVQLVKQLYSPANYTYPHNRGIFNQNWWLAVMVRTDTGSTGFCTARRISRSLSNSRHSEVWMYLFAHAPQYKTSAPLFDNIFGPGNVLTPHGSEIRYVFNSLPSSATATDKQVARAMSASWVHFAAKGAPSVSKRWPKYTVQNEAVFRIAVGKGPGAAGLEHKVRMAACNFWDRRAARGRRGGALLV